MADKSYIAKERLYLDADGNVVGADDPNRATLLVGKGGTLTAEQAAKYGLTGEKAPAAEAAPAPATPEPISLEVVSGPGELRYKVDGTTVTVWVADGLASAPEDAQTATIEEGNTTFVTTVQPEGEKTDAAKAKRTPANKAKPPAENK